MCIIWYARQAISSRTSLQAKACTSIGALSTSSVPLAIFLPPRSALMPPPARFSTASRGNLIATAGEASLAHKLLIYMGQHVSTL